MSGQSQSDKNDSRAAVKRITIAMIIAVSLPLALSIPGVLTALGDNLKGGTRNGIAFWMTFFQNAGALVACVMTLRSTERYWLPAIWVSY